MANQTSEQYTENLFQAIDTIIANRVSKLPYDQTVICEITNTDNAEYGRYLVKAYNQSSGYNDVSFTAYCESAEYNVGDRVYVRIPAGDYTQQKVITGTYIAESYESTLVNTDAYWTAEEITLGEGNDSLDTISVTSLDIYTLQAEEIFPGYSICRIKFRPRVSENLMGVSYTMDDLDVKFKIIIEYTVPTILNSSLFTSEFTISVRSLNPNLFRNSNKLLTYDINLDECVGVPIQLKKITLSNLQYNGERSAAFQNDALEFTDISLSFGYYITNNIGQFLALYTDNNFYSPSDNGVHIIYAHYYDSTDFSGKKLEHISAKENYFKASFDNENAIETEIVDSGSYYTIPLPVSKTTNNTLNNKRDSYIVYLACIEEERTLAQDSISLINVNYYSEIDDSIGAASSFLTAKALTPEEEQIANYNNGVYYIYGQDGKPTDSSASFITRRAYIKFVDYYSSNNLENGELAVQFPQTANSMIVPVNTTPQLDEFDKTIAYVEYKIANYYAQNKKNNTITWTFTLENITYSYNQELLFGYSGSQGADYSLILTLTDAAGKEIPAITMGQNAEYKVVSHLYDYSNNEISGQTVTYAVVNTGTSRWPSWLRLNGNTLTVIDYSAPVETQPTTYYCAVVKASIPALSIEAFMPIALAQSDNTSLSGPTTITYDITGKKPFASKLPYKLYTENSSILREITATLVIPENNPSSALKSLYPSIDNNFLSLPSVYSTIMKDKPPTVIIKEGTQVVWIQPLYIWQNKYPNSMTNSEANKVTIPENGTTDMQIINTNVGRVLTDGTGLFIGDYGTSINSNYGLYAFKKSGDGVDNVFKLLADGTFAATGDLGLSDASSLNGTVKGVLSNGSAATLKDIAQAIKDLKDAIAEIPDLPAAATTALNRINLEIEENG